MDRRRAWLAMGLSCGLMLAPALCWVLSHSTSVRGAPAVRFVRAGGQYAGICDAPDRACATIQYAIDQAADGDEIRVSAGAYQDLHLREGANQVVYVDKSVMILGGWDTAFVTRNAQQFGTIVDAGMQGRGIVVSGPISPTLDGLQVTRGYSDGNGGGVLVVGASATISGCTVLNNHAAYGGGLFLSDSRSILSGNQVTDNGALWDGGGLFLDRSPAQLDGNYLARNTTDKGHGGGLYMQQSDASLRSDTITDNHAPADFAASVAGNEGGGVYIRGGSPSLVSAEVTANSAWSGGGVYLNGSSASLSQSAVSRNVASQDGGGIYLIDSPALLRQNTIKDNQATGTGRMGGGLYARMGSPILQENHVEGNRAAYGGGLYLERGTYTLRSNTVVSNTAGITGGGIYLLGGAEGGPAKVLYNVVASNSGQTAGGGIYLYGMLAATVTGNSVLNNTAGTYGGGLFLGPGQHALDANTISGNNASGPDGVGGGLYLDGSGATTVASMGRNVFNENLATSAGGGIFSLKAEASLDGGKLLGNRANGAHGAGGGFYAWGGRVVLTNTLAAGNVAVEGSGLYLDGPGYTLVHTTLASNQDQDLESGGGLVVGKRWNTEAASASLVNTIVAGQQVGVRAGDGSSVSMSHTLWGRGAWLNTTDKAGSVATIEDIEGDPNFAGPGDYHLGDGSPAIDRGLDTGTNHDLDRRLRPNPATGIADLGAYEWYLERIIPRVYLPLVQQSNEY